MNTEELISLLRKNARASTEDLARELNSTDEQVAEEIAGLERDGVVLGYQAGDRDIHFREAQHDQGRDFHGDAFPLEGVQGKRREPAAGSTVTAPGCSAIEGMQADGILTVRRSELPWTVHARAA